MYDFFLPALTLILITLKILGYVTASWLWVLAPLWVPFIFVAVIFVLAACFTAIVSLAFFKEF